MFRYDHARHRLAYPQCCALFVHAALGLGLRRERVYAFPATKLKAIYLQRIGDDATASKIFVSELDLASFPADVAERIRSDCATQAAAVDHRDFIRHIERFEARGVLDQTDADAFIDRKSVV